MSRVLIVGAGPAGVRAAEALVQAGLRPVVVDEGIRAGGQIYRRSFQPLARNSRTLYGSEADKADAVHAVFDRMLAEDHVTLYSQTSVLALQDGVAHLLGPEGAVNLAYDRLILATGAMDRVIPLPGWQGAGVYTLGAAQIALKSQGVTLGRRMVLVGSGPLLTLVAGQLIKAGALVEAVLDTAPMSAQVRGGLAMAMARPWVTLRGAMMRAKLGRRYHAGVQLQRIETDATGPVALHWRNARGEARVSPCDAVALGWHLRAETHLADLAGVVFEWNAGFAQWLPKIDKMGRAAEAVYLAGDGARLMGADAAEIAGRLAATACLMDMGHPAIDPTPDLRRLRRMARFAGAVQRAFPWPAEMLRTLPDDTVMCRCEGISAGALRATVDWSGPEANRAKSLSRVGMGRCQGRYCQLAAAEVIAGHAAMPVPEVGRLRSQPPVRPAPVSAFLGR
jgi:NADPH-dependent 2,4-dienoyl-CoA reductase/sulfur reductase-like enzyme